MSSQSTQGIDRTEPTIGALAHDLSQQLPELIHSEPRLATVKGARR